MNQENTIFVPAGAGHRHNVLGSTHINKVSPAQTGGAFSVIEIIVPPGAGPDMHIHETDSEFFYIVEGMLTVSVPEGDIQAGPGDFCFLRAGAAHGFRNNGTQDVRGIAVITPGVDAQRLFTEIDAQMQGDRVDLDLLGAIAMRNGVRMAA